MRFFLELPITVCLSALAILPNLCVGTSGTPLQYVIVDRLGAFLLNQIYLITIYRSTIQLHLSDQCGN